MQRIKENHEVICKDLEGQILEEEEEEANLWMGMEDEQAALAKMKK